MITDNKCAMTSTYIFIYFTMTSTYIYLTNKNFRKLTKVHNNGKVGTFLKPKTDVDVNIILSCYPKVNKQ